METLDEKLKEFAYNNHNEIEQILEEKLNQLKYRLMNVEVLNLSQNSLRNDNLVRFLRAKQLDVDKTVKLIQSWYKFHMEHKLWFRNLISQDFKSFSKLYRVLQEPDPVTGAVICVFPMKYCLEIFTPNYVRLNPLAIIRSHMWFVDRISRDVRAQICGITCVISFEGMTFWDHIQLFRIINISEVIALVKYLTDSVCLKLNAVHVFHEPQFIHIICNAILPLLNNKMKESFYFHGKDSTKLSGLLPQYAEGSIDKLDEFNWVDLQIEKESSLLVVT